MAFKHSNQKVCVFLFLVFDVRIVWSHIILLPSWCVERYQFDPVVQIFGLESLTPTQLNHSPAV